MPKKVIISHDVDHMTVWEHWKDLILPKFQVRSKLELLSGKIGLDEFCSRQGDYFKNQWQRVDEVMEFNDSQGIKATFFFGVNNGVGLNYKLKHVEKWVPRAVAKGFEVGVHGIDFDAQDKMQKEYCTFQRISGLEKFGIRMHYLRQNDHTFEYMEKSGYTYDATDSGFKNPYKIGNMWEFPLQVMDGWAINGERRMQARNLDQAKAWTLEQIERAEEVKLEYLSILFHDRYYSKSFRSWKAWYEWLIVHLKERGYEFITHEKAIEQLNSRGL